MKGGNEESIGKRWVQIGNQDFGLPLIDQGVESGVEKNHQTSVIYWR